MHSIVRPTKFRHVFGKAAKKSDCYDGIRISKNATDSSLCSVNPKFVAVITEAAGGGAFIVLPLERIGRVDRETPLVSGHKAAVIDIAWCPHNDYIIASGSEDCTVKIWQIPANGLTETIREPMVDLQGHQRRVNQVLWHPSALNVLLSSGNDMRILIWDIGTGTVLSSIECHTDMILSVAWNYDGSRIVTSCKDKMFRVIDARSGEVLKSGIGHQSSKPARAIYLKDGRIFSTGFSKMAERQYAVWDENDLSAALTMVELDSSNGVLIPIYDEDVNIIYLCGKGDSNIQFFEYTPEPPYIHYLSLYSSGDPQRGLGFMPKRALNIASCEIARFYKLFNSGLCEVISFTVPRKATLFQEDLYPDTTSGEHALTAEEWRNGKNSGPKLIPVLELLEGEKAESNPQAVQPLKSDDHSGDTKKPPIVARPSFRAVGRVSQRIIADSNAKTSANTTTAPITSTTQVEQMDNKRLDQINEKLSEILERMADFDRRLKLVEARSNKSNPSEESAMDGDMQF